MDLQGKRLLILGGATQCLKVVEASKEMGVHSIVTDINANEMVASLADEVLPFSVTDAHSLIQWCKENPVDGVLNYNIDYAQHAHQRICSELDLPCYGTAEQYHILTDKTAFKKYCVECGVDVIPDYEENEISDVEYPVLVKPGESSGSRGTTVCYSLESLKLAVEEAKKETRNGKVIIEKYLYGRPDFSMTYIIIDGEPHLIRTLDRYVGRPEDHLQRQCICARCPSIYTDLYLEKAHDKVKNMLKKLGLRNATVFMQGFVDGETFRFYDPGIRFSGSEYERMLKSATGVDIVKAFIAYSLGESLTEFGHTLTKPYALSGLCGLQLFIEAHPGIIKHITGIKEIESIPEVVTVLQKHDVGYVVPDSGDIKQRIFEIVVLSENSKENVERLLSRIEELLVIEDQFGNNMVTPLVDANKLFYTV